MKGLLDPPAGHAVAPRRTRVRGTPHHLAYINDREHELLRSRGGGVTDDGGQLLGPAGVPAYDGDDSGPAMDPSETLAAQRSGNYIGPEEDTSAADAAKAALLARLSAPIDQTQRNFVAGGAPGAPAGSVPAYNYGAFPTAPPVIGAMQPLPAPQMPAGPSSGGGGGLPPAPNVGLPGYAPPAYGMRPATLQRLQQIGVMPQLGSGGPAGAPSFSKLLGRMR